MINMSRSSVKANLDAIALAFLRTFPTPDEARAATVERIAAILTTVRYATAEAKAHEIWQRVQQPQLTADPIVTRAKARLVLTLTAQLQVLVTDIAAYDREISRVFAQHADSAAFASLPRAGKRLAPRLLTEWGDDRGRYADAASVQALAGTSPVVVQSGNYASVHKRYACSKPLRNALHQFAWQSTLQEGWANAYYRRKRREGKSHTKAVRALANQWVRIIHALWCKREIYDSAVFVAAQQAHARRAA